MDLTIVVLTKNEEQNIETVISNARLLTEHIIIVDAGSIDKTVELAEKMGTKVFHRAWDDDFSAQRNFAQLLVKTKWVLHLDADERMNSELIDEIQKCVESKEEVLYEITRRSNAFGKLFRYGVLSPDTVVRLFPTASVTWKEKVHERPESVLPVRKLKGYIEHYTYTSFEQYLSKMNNYSSIWAENVQNRKKASILKDIIFRPTFAFLKMYIFKLGFCEGWLGFVLALNYANYTLSKYVKLKLMARNLIKTNQ